MTMINPSKLWMMIRPDRRMAYVSGRWSVRTAFPRWSVGTRKNFAYVGWMSDSVIHHFPTTCRITLSLIQPTALLNLMVVMRERGNKKNGNERAWGMFSDFPFRY